MSTPFLEVSNAGRNAWWRYLVTALVLFLTWGLAQIAGSIVMVASGLFDLRTGAMVGKLAPWQFVAMLSSFPVMGAALLLCVKRVHRRAPATLLGPGGGLRWKPAIAAAAIQFGLLGVGTCVQWWIAPGSLHFSFEPRAFLLMLPLVLVLVPLQSATEELLYRGWLMQALGRGGRWKWPAVVISSALFALSHLGSGFIEGGLGALDLLCYLAIALLFAWATLRDGRLERAIGLHAGLNLYGFLVVGSPMPMVELPTLLTDPLVTNDPANLISIGMTALAVWLSGRWTRTEAQSVTPGRVVARGAISQ